MKKFKSVVLLGLFGLVTAAQNGAADSEIQMNVADFVTSEMLLSTGDTPIRVNSTDNEDAENLALLAERLFYTTGIIYVTEVANEALQLDPNNKRAQLYLAMAKPIERLRGLLNRVYPLAQKMGSRALWKLADIRDQTPYSFRAFLLDGPKDIETESDLQDLFLAIRSDLTELSATLEQLNINGFQVNRFDLAMYYSFWDYWENDWVTTIDYFPLGGWYACPVTRIKSGVYAFEACRFSEIEDESASLSLLSSPSRSYYRSTRLALKKRVFLLDSADLKSLKIGVDAINMYLSLFTTSFKYDGLINIAKKLTVKYEDSIELGGTITEEKLIQTIQSEPLFLTLHEQNFLAEIRLMGHDFLDSLEWLQVNFLQACGSKSGEQRTHQMIGPEICQIDDLNKILFSGREALNGEIEIHLENNFEEFYSTRIDLTRLFNGHVSDLKSLLPHKFNQCGQSSGIPDPSLNGILPNRDFIEAIRFIENPDFLRPVCRP